MKLFMIVHITRGGKERPIRGPFTSVEKAEQALEEHLRKYKQLSISLMERMTSGPEYPELKYYKESDRKDGEHWNNMKNWIIKEM